VLWFAPERGVKFIMKAVCLNIIKSILICNIFCCLIASLYLWDGRSNFIVMYLFLLAYSYVMFGISGAVLWFLIYLQLSKFINNKYISHFVSCGLASLFCAPVFYLAIGESNGAKESFVYLTFIIPTALVCLVFYLIMYAKEEKFNHSVQRTSR
jgi:hypothetical protein